MNILEQPSPNHDSRGDEPVDMLVLHYTGMPSAQEALYRMCSADAKVSAHYMVDEVGKIFKLVEESERAWHAGVSSWRGHTNINARSIGIEIANPGHEFGYLPFPQVQMDAVAELCHDILSRHDIEARNIVGHSDVAPERKEDPGELFNWRWLAQKGIGLWPEISGKELDAWLMHEEGFIPLQTQLSDFGYNIELTGVMDAQTQKVIIAFQRHFRPDHINGMWDVKCGILLEGLMELVHHHG